MYVSVCHCVCVCACMPAYAMKRSVIIYYTNFPFVCLSDHKDVCNQMSVCLCNDCVCMSAYTVCVCVCMYTCMCEWSVCVYRVVQWVHLCLYVCA